MPPPFREALAVGLQTRCQSASSRRISSTRIASSDTRPDSLPSFLANLRLDFSQLLLRRGAFTLALSADASVFCDVLAQRLDSASCFA